MFLRVSFASKAPSSRSSAVLALLLLALSAGWTVATAQDKIVVASKIDTEGALLGNIILAILKAHDLAVENKIQLGPTNIVRAAILAGQIDIWVADATPQQRTSRVPMIFAADLGAAENRICMLPPGKLDHAVATWS